MWSKIQSSHSWDFIAPSFDSELDFVLIYMTKEQTKVDMQIKSNIYSNDPYSG